MRVFAIIIIYYLYLPIYIIIYLRNPFIKPFIKIGVYFIV